MDPITIITTAGWAIQSTSQVTIALYAFVQGTREIDETVQGFVNEIDSLKLSLSSIESCLKNPTLRAAGNAKGEAQDVFASLHQALHNCQDTLDKLSSTLNKAKGQHSPGRGVFRRATTHFALNLKLPDIAIYRAQIATHTSAMEIALQTINLYTTIRGPEVVLSSITPKLDLLVKLVAANNPGDIESTRLLKKSAGKVISSARTVVSQSTVWGGSVAGEEVDHGKQQRIMQWNKTTTHDTRRPATRPGDSHGFDFVPEEEEEDLELFSHLVKKGQHHMKENELPEAEVNYRSALEAAGRTSLRNKSTLEHNDANLQLASILLRQGKFNEAKEFLSQLLSKAGMDLPDADAGMKQQNQACHMLAKVYFELGELEDADRFCKKAMIARRNTRHGTSSPEFHESAELRGQIWDKKGDSTRANGYRAMITPLVEPRSKRRHSSKEPIHIDTGSIYSSSTRSEKREISSSSTKSSEVSAQYCLSPSTMSIIAPSHKHRPSEGSIVSGPVITGPTRTWTMETVLAQPHPFHSNSVITSLSTSAEPEVLAEQMLKRVLKLLLKTPYNYKAHTSIITRYFNPHVALRKAIYAGHLEVVWFLLYRFSEIKDFWESHRKSWKQFPFTKDRTRLFPDGINEGYEYIVEHKDGSKSRLTLLDDACSVTIDSRIRRNMVDILLEYGVNPNPPCTKPLTSSIKEGHYDLIPILLHYGTEVDGHAEGEATPLTMVLAKGKPEGEDIACLLMSHGASIDIHIGKHALTPFHRAAYLGWAKVIRALLIRNVDIESPSPQGTALCIAAAEKRLDIVEILLDKGANVEAVRPPQNASPLCLAAETGDSAVVQSLLDHRADVNHALLDGTTAYELAAEHRFRDVMKILKEGGAKI